MPLNENAIPDPTQEVIPAEMPIEESPSLIEQITSLVDKPNAKFEIAKILSGDDKRPKNWKKSSKSSYYKERFALGLKKVLDAMAVDLKDRIFRYEDFSLSKNSLYLQINQSRLYLIDKLDEDGYYAKLLQTICITRPPKGVQLSFNRDIRNPEAFSLNGKALIVSDKPKNPLREEIDEWLEQARQGDIFYKEDINIDNDEVEALKESFVGVAGIAPKITNKHIKIVRFE